MKIIIFVENCDVIVLWLLAIEYIVKHPFCLFIHDEFNCQTKQNGFAIIIYILCDFMFCIHIKHVLL